MVVSSYYLLELLFLTNFMISSFMLWLEEPLGRPNTSWVEAVSGKFFFLLKLSMNCNSNSSSFVLAPLVRNRGTGLEV